MSIQEGILFGVLGCLMYQLVQVYRYRGSKHVWPWDDAKRHMSLDYFLYGFFTKLLVAGALAFVMTYTQQISGPWAAFLVGMVAERIILVLGDRTLKELPK